MSIMKKLGLNKVINAAGYQTVWGGSLMPSDVVEAMIEASKQFTDLRAMLDSAGDYIAAATYNEAAFITGGAAAGIQTAAAACMTRGNRHEVIKFPEVNNREIIMYTSQRNPYDVVLRSVGTRLCTIGLANRTNTLELEASITSETAAIFYCLFSGQHKIREASLSLEETIEVAHANQVPVILDAAGQIPPISSLWNYTRMGVDLVIFSGGKGLRGPQSSGLILGKKEMVDWCKMIGFPQSTCLRSLKISKEDVAGLVAAIDRALSLDEEALIETYEAIVEDIVLSINALDLDGVQGSRLFPNQSGQPVPAAVVRFVQPNGVELRNRVVSDLQYGDPQIVVRLHGVDGLAVYPVTLHEEEGSIVSSRLAEVVSSILSP